MQYASERQVPQQQGVRSDRKAPGLSNSVGRALSILRLLNNSPHPLSFSDIKVELGLPKSTTSLLLSTLESLGYLTRDGESRRYWITPPASALRFPAADYLALSEAARPFLRSLSSEIALTSFISVLEGDQVLFLVKADGPHHTSCDVYSGRRASAQCTAVGKVLLAWMNAAEQERFLDRHRVIPHTNRTITAKDALLEELKRVRQLGYAIDDREESLSIRCLAVPVITAQSAGTVAVGITGSLSEIRPDNLPALVCALQEAARQIRYPERTRFAYGAPSEFAGNFGAPNEH